MSMTVLEDADDIKIVDYHIKGIVTFQVEVELDVPIKHYKHDPTQATHDPIMQIKHRLLEAAKVKVGAGNCRATIEETIIK